MWIDLDDFFSEPDQDDNLTYNYSVSADISISINNGTHVVTVYSENPNTVAEAEKIAIEIKRKISEGLDNLGLTKENTDIRLGSTILLGTEADVAITLMVNLDSAETKNGNILAEAVSECYNQYNGLLSLLGQKSASFLIN